MHVYTVFRHSYVICGHCQCQFSLNMAYSMTKLSLISARTSCGWSFTKTTQPRIIMLGTLCESHICRTWFCEIYGICKHSNRTEIDLTTPSLGFSTTNSGIVLYLRGYIISSTDWSRQDLSTGTGISHQLNSWSFSGGSSAILSN